MKRTRERMMYDRAYREGRWEWLENALRAAELRWEWEGGWREKWATIRYLRKLLSRRITVGRKRDGRLG